MQPCSNRDDPATNTPMREARLRFAVLLGVLVLALMPVSVASAAPAVTNTNDSGPGSLRAAIEGAAPGETVSVPAGTYTLTSGPLKIEKSLTVAGHSASDTIVRAGTSSSVLAIAGPGNNVTISDLTVRDGLVVVPSGVVFGAGISNNGAGLTLQRLVVTNNRAVTDGGPGSGGGIVIGGGIYSSSESLLTIRESVISGNLASANGGIEAGGGIALGVG